MRLSLFTPTNNSLYLAEAYASLRQQDYANWDWVIVLNGDEKLMDGLSHIAPEILSDRRVRLLPSGDTSGGKIGALKREACDHCRGDAFVELDHDDVLVPGTLAKVAAAFEAGAGFVYSDVATFKQIDDEVLQSIGYAPAFGWEHEEVNVYGRPFVVTKCFPLSPRMLCEVHYAPDHVRCWSRSAYYNAGGHDSSLAVGDDHDLVCRTYVSGAKFHHLGCCGYLYRFHDSNTVKLRGRAIKEQQSANRRKYLTPLIREWCKREGHLEVDLLAESRKAPEFAWQPSPKPVLLPYADNSLGYLVASDVLQFVYPDQVTGFFNEAYRVLRPGGYLTVTVPDAEHGRYADQNPDHRSRWNANTFLHYAMAEFARLVKGVECRFDLIQTDDFYPTATHQQLNMMMLRGDLCALKGQKHPGPQRI